jgi:hypothetical protein
VKSRQFRFRKRASGSNVEVLNVSNNGIWLLANDREYFLPYGKFPWFKKANVVDVCKVKLLHGYHLYWPALDVDLEFSSLEHLEKYPLVYR